MLRWILLVCALVLFAAAFKISSPGLLATTLVVAFVAAIASFFGFVSERVGTVAQGQSSRELELLLTAGKKPGGSAASKPKPARDGGGNESFLYASMAGAGVAADRGRDPDAGGSDNVDAGGGDGGGGSDGGGGGD